MQPLRTCSQRISSFPVEIPLWRTFEERLLFCCTVCSLMAAGWACCIMLFLPFFQFQMSCTLKILNGIVCEIVYNVINVKITPINQTHFQRVYMSYKCVYKLYELMCIKREMSWYFVSLMLPEANLHFECNKQEQCDLLQSWLHFSSYLLTCFLRMQCYGSDSFIWKCHLYMLLYWVPQWLKFHIRGFWLNLIWVEYPTVIVSLSVW